MSDFTCLKGVWIKFSMCLDITEISFRIVIPPSPFGNFPSQSPSLRSHPRTSLPGRRPSVAIFQNFVPLWPFFRTPSLHGHFLGLCPFVAIFVTLSLRGCFLRLRPSMVVFQDSIPLWPFSGPPSLHGHLGTFLLGRCPSVVIFLPSIVHFLSLLVGPPLRNVVCRPLSDFLPPSVILLPLRPHPYARIYACVPNELQI